MSSNDSIPPPSHYYYREPPRKPYPYDPSYSWRRDQFSRESSREPRPKKRSRVASTTPYPFQASSSSSSRNNWSGNDPSSSHPFSRNREIGNIGRHRFPPPSSRSSSSRFAESPHREEPYGHDWERGRPERYSPDSSASRPKKRSRPPPLAVRLLIPLAAVHLVLLNHILILIITKIGEKKPLAIIHLQEIWKLAI